MQPHAANQANPAVPVRQPESFEYHKILQNSLYYAVSSTYNGYSYLHGLLPTRLQNLTSCVSNTAATYGLFKAATYSSAKLCTTFPPGIIQSAKIIIAGANCIRDIDNCALESAMKCGLPIYIKGPLLLIALSTGAYAVISLKNAVSPTTENPVNRQEQALNNN